MRAWASSVGWRKAALWSAGGLALLAIGGAIAVRSLVDPERLIQDAQQKVRAAWQRDLRVESLTLRLFPYPHLEASKVALGNPPWAKAPNLVEADEVSADIDLLPLLVGRVRINTLSLQGVRAALEEAEDGAVTWDLARTGGGMPAPGTAQAHLLDIGDIRIRDVWIHHRVKKRNAEPLHIEEARFKMQPGLRDVEVTAQVTRFNRPLTITAKLADLSRLAVEGAASQGSVELDWGATKVSATGAFPLHRALKGQDLRVEAKSPSLDDVFGFFNVPRGRSAPLELRLEARERQGRVEVTNLVATLGQLKVSGAAQVLPGKDKRTFTAQLRAERLDWLKTLQESGGTLRPRRKDGEVFHADPVAWRAVAVLGALDGTAELRIASLRLGNGLELRDVRARATMGDGRLAFEPFATQMLGGAANGSLRFDSGKKTVQVRLDGDKLLLQQWFEQRGSAIAFTGGPMKVRVAITLAGDTYRDLASSIAGPVTIRMGPGKWASRRAGEVEEMMVDAFASRGSQQIAFDCLSANLGFRNGRAEGRRLLGARTDASRLVTSGFVDFGREEIDLRGRVQANKGVTLGLATFANGVQIHGKLAKPSMQLDPEDQSAMIVRAAAAIATSGATLLGSALLDAASDKSDACEAPFR